MVMPFGVKNVVTEAADGSIPATVNFDALWERVYDPALEQLGYESVRADYDLGALVINDMIQRLAIADLVLADVTLPNANVYYEIGVRHAAKARGCVLVAADWSRPTFDLAQMRQCRFPLPDGQIPERDAAEAVERLIELIGPRLNATSPVFDAVAGYPDNIDEQSMPPFRSIVGEIAAFDAQVRGVFHLPTVDRARAAREIVARNGGHVVRDVVAIRLSRLLCETASTQVDWQYLLDYIDKLPEHLTDRPDILERRALALGKQGDFASSAGFLEQLIAMHGATSERFGMLGGRYKSLMRVAHQRAERRRYLNLAITAYEEGMRRDLNDYYPASNLPRLYRLRGGRGDITRADEVAVIATEGCRRAIALGTDDAWTRASLLGMAFYRGDVTAAQELTARVEEDGANAWKLESTLSDLREDIEHCDPTVRDALEKMVRQLEQLLDPQCP